MHLIGVHPQPPLHLNGGLLGLAAQRTPLLGEGERQAAAVVGSGMPLGCLMCPAGGRTVPGLPVAAAEGGSMVVDPQRVDRRNARRRRVKTAVLMTCAVLALGLAVLPHPAITVPWFVVPLQSLVPVVCLVAAALAVVMVVVRQHWAALLLLAGVLAGLFPALVPMAPPEAASGGGEAATELTLLSLNAEYAGVDPAALAAVIKQNEVDVLVLVEADEGLLAGLRARGALDGLPHRTAEIPETPQGGPAGGAVILSAHPLRSEGVVPRFAGYRHFDQPVAVVQDPGLGPVRVVGIHPVPPIGADFVPSWDQTLRGLDGWQAGRSDLPLVLAGDFNASGAHPQFRALAEGFTPAAAAAGPWPGPTWPVGSWAPPFTQIDHVLLRGLVPQDYRRLTLVGTDHRGILTTVTAGGP